MLKKRYLFLIIIICLFTISTVSAEDNTTSDIISECNNVNSLEANIVDSNMNAVKEAASKIQMIEITSPIGKEYFKAVGYSTYPDFISNF